MAPRLFICQTAAMTAPIVFDRKLYAARRHRAARAGAASFLVRQAAENLAERLFAVKQQFDQALDLNSRAESFEILAPFARQWLHTSLAPGDDAAHLCADEEALPFLERSFDLISSVLALHAVNDLPGALIQIRRALTPDGLFVAALFGEGTLGELRRAFAAGESERSGGASPRVAPFADVRDMGALLQRAGFAMPVADVERFTVRYGSFATLADDLRALGETNSLAQRRRSLLAKGVFATIVESYRAASGDSEGHLAATFDIIYLTGWAGRDRRMKD
jgi:SAM-dependent methyltransferase